MNSFAKLLQAPAQNSEDEAFRREIYPSRTVALSLLFLFGFLAASIQLQGQDQQPSQAQPTQSQTSPSAPAQTSPAAPAATDPAQSAPAPAAIAPAPAPIAATQPTSQPEHTQTGEVTEEELKQWLVGKQLFLRGGYLGDSLSFNEHGAPIGHPLVGSYTLSEVQIEKVHLTKHKVELEGDRYALHFLGATPYEDAAKSVERVKITPKKKVLRITVDREQLLKQKKYKEKKKKSGTDTTAQPAKEPVASSETDVAGGTAEKAPANTTVESDELTGKGSESVTGEAAEQPGDQAADQASVTYTTNPAHAAKILREALDRILAPNLDDKVRAQMPEFWQLYYQAQAAGVDYRPHDPNVFRSNAVDQQAKVLTSIAPQSNEFAQASGISGQALYRVVIGSDGNIGQVAVERPIGFGLDENAVAAIRKATFQPAIKDGKPVAETLDLAVLFRIYSQRTSAAGSEKTSDEPSKPVLPGPYSAKPQ
jgi:TonB family protein